ncbi:hypothetical protein QM012_000695 [Aureobasidium pullulans]|uniref:Uncharacterized protein n=1 Tax=Aureobasidium pullulans TaxID=5580 RepID=A0ABR0TWP9_AURPU
MTFWSSRIQLSFGLTPTTTQAPITSRSYLTGSLHPDFHRRFHHALWAVRIGIKLLFGVYNGSSDNIILGELFNAIKTFVLPPQKLEWYQTQEFHTVLGFLMLLLFMWDLKCFLHRRR